MSYDPARVRQLRGEVDHHRREVMDINAALRVSQPWAIKRQLKLRRLTLSRIIRTKEAELAAQEQERRRTGRNPA